MATIIPMAGSLSNPGELRRVGMTMKMEMLRSVVARFSLPGHIHNLGLEYHTRKVTGPGVLVQWSG